MSKSNDANRKTIFLIGVLCLQTLIVLLNTFWNYLFAHEKAIVPLKTVTTLSLITSLYLGLMGIYLIKELISLAQVERDFKINKAVLEKDRDLIAVLSNHRHDFQNHLQVITGLVQMARNDSAVAYIKEVTKGLNAAALTTGQIKNLGVAAMFMVKRSQAEERNIQLEVDLQSDLGGLNIPATDISRILGNLLDNALDAMEGLGETEKKVVNVSFAEDDDFYLITVLNKRPLIPLEYQQKVFQKGFSTKGLAGNGLGLPIVKELTEKNGGVVNLVSEVSIGTLFSLSFPKGIKP